MKITNLEVGIMGELQVISSFSPITVDEAIKFITVSYEAAKL